MKLNAIPAMLSMLPSVLTGAGLQDLEKIKAIVRKAYPRVRQLPTETLAEWMGARASLLLIDVRSSDEFAVSHLRGAINLQKIDQLVGAVRQRPASKAVLYCSVGFRSSRLAQAVAEKGFPGILNLEGSIFQWANEGRPLFQGDQPAHKVHPYAKRWANLLQPGLASDP